MPVACYGTACREKKLADLPDDRGVQGSGALLISQKKRKKKRVRPLTCTGRRKGQVEGGEKRKEVRHASIYSSCTMLGKENPASISETHHRNWKKSLEGGGKKKGYPRQLLCLAEHEEREGDPLQPRREANCEKEGGRTAAEPLGSSTGCAGGKRMRHLQFEGLLTESEEGGWGKRRRRLASETRRGEERGGRVGSQPTRRQNGREKFLGKKGKTDTDSSPAASAQKKET